MDKMYIRTSKSVFLKYLLSYLSILIIPILIITLILSNTIFNILEKEIFENDKSSLLMSSYNLTMELETCYKISEQLSSNEKITPFKYEENISSAIALIDKLKKYMVSNKFFDKIFLHFFNDTYIYSESSSYSLEYFFNTYDPNKIIKTELNEVLNNINTPVFIKNPDNKQLFYAVPFISNSETIGTMLFLINNNSLNKVLGNDLGLNRQTYIFDSTKKLLNLSQDDDIISIKSDDLNTLYELNNKLNKNDYITETIDMNMVFASKIKPLDIIYISITPSKYVFKDLLTVQIIMIGTLLISFLFGIILIFILLKINYKPIEQLKSLSKTIKKQSSLNPSPNEIDLIRNTIMSLNDRNTELEYEIEKHIPIKQNFILNELINGNISDNNEFLNICADAKLNLTSTFHCIVTVKSSILPSSIIKTINTISSLKLNIDYEFLVNQIAPDLSIFLVGISTKKLNIESKYEIDDNLIISFGSLQEDLTLIPKSYIDSRTNLDLDNYTNNKLLNNFIKKYDGKVKLISSALYNFDLIKLEALVFSIINDLDQENVPFEITRNIYFELIIMFNIFIEKNKHSISYKNIDLSTLYDIYTDEAFKEVFLEVFKEFLDIIYKKETDNLPKLSVNSIKKCIDQNYTDYSFSLQLIADKFQVSLSYLSQYFKERTGSTILDYITTLKMNKAKDLLLTTNMTLKDIAEKIGYINVSSFIRRFKQVTGMTPGEYKKNNIKLGD